MCLFICGASFASMLASGCVRTVQQLLYNSHLILQDYFLKFYLVSVSNVMFSNHIFKYVFLFLETNVVKTYIPTNLKHVVLGTADTIPPR